MFRVLGLGWGDVDRSEVSGSGGGEVGCVFGMGVDGIVLSVDHNVDASGTRSALTFTYDYSPTTTKRS